ncbi:multiprotein-bridging factor 1 family protein [Chitinophaga filiformis]|uniref:Helix-turn-helix domain-containing protein n=1 Tax=Chitinophaga filiformis TaxID=104663 RepID=A0ABY4IAH8_CHIFI|nr:helix-turn-helix transcriptional regulator [Chitinophaga filiformis]UPK72658.1 helix-turn-helix domain-containing protein [Chitinophaga filiformis]
MSKIFEDALNALPAHGLERAAMSLEVADRIHAILEKKGMSHKELAQALGKSESEISKWMRGTHNFTFETIAKINLALGTKLIQVPKGRVVRQANGRLATSDATVIEIAPLKPAVGASDAAQQGPLYEKTKDRKATLPLTLNRN